MVQETSEAAIPPDVPPTEKARATRARLIESAAESFVADGYGATSVRELAQRSNMTSGAIYGHFSGKANLLGEAVRLRISQDLESHVGASYEDNLADWLAHDLRDYRTRRSLRALLVEGAAAARVDDDVRTLLHDVMQAKLDEWAALYRATWEEEGLDPEIDPEALLVLVWSVELGLGVLEALDIELPKPGVLSKLVGTLVGSLSPARRRTRRT
jgi:AcrR family transcriptional regulator